MFTISPHYPAQAQLAHQALDRTACNLNAFPLQLPLDLVAAINAEVGLAKLDDFAFLGRDTLTLGSWHPMADPCVDFVFLEPFMQRIGQILDFVICGNGEAISKHCTSMGLVSSFRL